MSTKPARPRSLLRYLTITSISMIVVGLFFCVMLLVVTIPSHTKATSALKDHGIRTRAVVTRCQEATHDDNGDPNTVTCWVRFTPPGGNPVESPLAFKMQGIPAGGGLTVVYDPQDTGIVVLPSDLGYWTTLFRHATDLFLLLLSAAMVPLGLGGLLLRRVLAPFVKRYTENSDEIDQAVTKVLGPAVAEGMAQAWTQHKPSGK